MSMFARTLLTSAAKLPTSVDYWSHRIHALLGCYVFFHFIYRYYIFFSSNQDDMGFDGPNLHRIDDLREGKQQYVYFIQIFLPHLLLQSTGFAFHLPLKRHPDGNRIWPQYRYEALIFSCRCLTLAFIAWRRKCHMWSLENGDCSILSAGVCVVLTMILVDLNTRWYKAHQKSNYTRTIRDLTAPQWLQYLMSSAQFHATVHCLLISNRLSVQIAALTVVQLSAFGMMICSCRVIQ